MADEFQTIPEILQYRAENESDREVYSFYNRDGLSSILTPLDIYTLAGKFAARLREWGFQPGDVIANSLPNSPERVITDFGVILSGCILTNCQVIEKDGSDLWHSASLSQCRGVIVCPRSHSTSYALFSSFLPDNTSGVGAYDVSVPQAPSIRRVVVCDRRQNDPQNSILDNLRHEDYDLLQHQVSPSDLAVLFATSGSTGFSKLIAETNESLLMKGRRFKSTIDSLHFTDRPFGWMGGFPFEFLVSGNRRVLQDQFDNQHATTPGGLWDILTTTQCAGAAILPNGIIEMIDHFRQCPPDNKLQYIVTFGQVMKKELLSAIGLLCHAMVVSYGSTEGGVLSFDVTTDAAQFKDYYTGKVVSDAQVKVVDEDGQEVDPGQDGNIYVKSDFVSKEYYNKSGDPGKSINMPIKDGWFDMGDRGNLHEDGSLYCYGRRGDVISVGAILVYLSWPENILSKCPYILTSSVIAVEEEDRNPKLCACVVTKTNDESKSLSEADVIDFFKSNVSDCDPTLKLCLSRAFIMDTLPLLPSGKVNKRKLKQYVTEKLEMV